MLFEVLTLERRELYCKSHRRTPNTETYCPVLNSFILKHKTLYDAFGRSMLTKTLSVSPLPRPVVLPTTVALTLSSQLVYKFPYICNTLYAACRWVAIWKTALVIKLSLLGYRFVHLALPLITSRHLTISPLCPGHAVSNKCKRFQCKAVPKSNFKLISKTFL